LAASPVSIARTRVYADLRLELRVRRSGKC
jgi:hypothetical protein